MFLVLFVLWWIFSGPLTVEIIMVGFFLSLILEFATVKILNYRFTADLSAAVHTGLWFLYFRILFLDIIRCCFAVLLLIYSPKIRIKPALRRFRSPLKTDGNKVIFANSITLTPGTITVDVQADHFVVHALDKKYLNGIEESAFAILLERIENDDDAK